LAEHLSDQEQLETLKRWWNDNGKQLLVTVVLVVGGWFAWQQWQVLQETKSSKGSVIYSEMVELAGQGPLSTLTDEEESRLEDLVALLLADFKGGQYAQYAGMMRARMAVEKGEFEAAGEALRQVVDSSDDIELANIARLRLARVTSAQQNYTEALDILDVDAPGMTSIFAELRGDIYYDIQDYTAARAAYQAALNALTEGNAGTRSLLELKLNRVLGH
jgi:predicted negative regulator of RcsB-dependent stress response